METKAAESRRKARVKILMKANQQSAWRGKRYYNRHLEQAVCVVRRLRLVDNKTLVAAGFNPGKERGS